MARFYKTARPQYLDYMYELPQEAILKAVQVADSGITANATTNEALKGLLKLNSLKQDQPDANRILSGYENQINTLAQQIQENPLQYRRKSADIGNLQRTIMKDFTSGDAFSIQNNYNTRQANYEAMKEDYKKNPDKYAYDDLEKLQGQLDNKYTGYKKGMYNVDRLREFVDINDFDKLGKDYEADIIERTGAYKGEDGFLYTDETKTKQVDGNQIKQHILEAMSNDKKLNDYYRQQIQLGNLGKNPQESANRYLEMLNETATRIGEKYGYKESKSGRTSIKNDDVDTATASWMLTNPVDSVVPDTIAGDTLQDKYSKVTGDGQPIEMNTINGLHQTANVISGNLQRNKDELRNVAKRNNIVIPSEAAKELQNGNFAILKTLTGKNGEKLSDKDIFQFQKANDELKFDLKVLREKERIASTKEDPSKFLAAAARNPELEVIGDFQTFGIVGKQEMANFTKAMKGVQSELETSQTWYDSPLVFSKESLETLPANVKNKYNTKLRDGISINDLIQDGTIQIASQEEKVYTTAKDEFGDTVTTESVRKVPGTGYQNFKVNAKNAKPTSTLNKDGKIMYQFNVNIDGYNVTTYLPEDQLQSPTLRKYMDTDAMSANAKYQRARAEGVIDRQGININGVDFYNEGGKDKASIPGVGSLPVEDAIQYMAAYEKKMRERILNRK